MKEQTAFQRLKNGLVSAPVLGYPNPKLPYILDTDARAVAAVLCQVQEEKERVIAYYSKILAPPPLERNYCVTRW